MKNRYLMKPGDPFPYIWTEALAARGDMTEVPQPAWLADEPEREEAPAGDELDSLTTVEALRKFALENGVELPASAKSKAAIRGAIREAAAAAEAEAEQDPLASE